MALLTSIPTDYGVNSEYWNIGAVQEDFKGQGTEVTFYGYASKEAREAGKQPLSGSLTDAPLSLSTLHHVGAVKPNHQPAGHLGYAGDVVGHCSPYPFPAICRHAH